MVRLKSKLLELYRNYNFANSFSRVVRFWKDHLWQVSPAAVKEMGLKIQNTAQPNGATERRNLRDNRACLLFPFSTPQKPGARDEQWRCEGFVDECGVDETHELGSVKEGFLSKLFRCKFLKSRAFTLIEIMVVVSVLGVLGMGLRNTVKKVMHDYEVYSAVNFCKKIDSALKNCYLINNTDREIGFIEALVCLVLLSYGLFVTENDLKPFLPNDLIRKEIDCSILDSMVEKASESGEEVDYDRIAEIKDLTNELFFNFNTPKCIKIVLVLEMTIIFVLKETLVDDFLKYYPNVTVSDVSEDFLELGLDLRGYKTLSINVNGL